MTAINRAAVIEAAAKAIHDVQNVDWRNWGNTNQAPYLKQAKAALPVIARELLAPLRELHVSVKTRERLPNAVAIPWNACSCGFRTHSACPTLRLLDQIEADVRGGER